MIAELIFGCVGIVSILFSAVRELLSNWKGDFQKLKPKKKALKMVFGALSAMYNCVTVIRGLGVYSGYIVYQGNPTIAEYLFSVTAVLGVAVSLTEDYYKRYSCARPSFVLVIWVIVSLALSFAALFVAQGVFMITRENAVEGERRAGVVMIVVAIILAVIISAATLFMNKVFLRLSLLVNVAIVPGCIAYVLVISGGHFDIRYFIDGVVLYVSYTYPALILSELFAIALICRQRKLSDDDKGISAESELGEQEEV